MKKIYVILIIAIAIILVSIVGVYKYVNQKVADVASSEAQATVSADEFAHAFTKDSVAAKKKYMTSVGGDNIIELKGKVSKKETDNFDQVNLFMTVQDVTIQCTCAPDQKQKASAAAIGTIVTLKGNFVGYDDDMIDGKIIRINKCVILK